MSNDLTYIILTDFEIEPFYVQRCDGVGHRRSFHLTRTSPGDDGGNGPDPVRSGNGVTGRRRSKWYYGTRGAGRGVRSKRKREEY